MLNDSVIYKFLYVLKNAAVRYFINSNMYNLFLHGISVSKTAKEESLFLRLYNKFKKLLDASWSNSVTARSFNRFFKLANHISFVKTVKDEGKPDSIDNQILENHAGNINYTDSSKIVSIVEKFFKSLIQIDCRTLGMLLLAFSATGLMLQLKLNKYGNLFTLAELFLLVAAVILIFIGRPLLSLYEGSWIAKKLAGFFNVREITLFNFLMLEKYKKYICILALGIIFGVLSFMLPFWTLVKAVGAVAVLVTVFWNVNTGVFMAIALAPFLSTTYNIAIAAICIMSFIARMLFKKDLQINKAPFSIAALIFASIILYNVIISFRPEGSIPVIIVYIVFIALYFVLTALIKDKQQLLTICAVLVFAGCAISLFGIYQYFWGTPTNYSWVDRQMFSNVSVRVYSVFNNPNVLGQYLVLIVPITVGMFFIRKDKLEKVVYAGMSLVMLICLMLTLSRGAWLGMMVALVVFVLLKDKRLIVLGVTLLLTLPFVLPASVINRFASIGNLKESSSAYRYSVWLGSIKIIKDFWIAGIGIGTKAFEFIYPGYALVGAKYALHSHNFYLQIIIETGILGFAVFLMMLLVFYKNMFSTVKKSDDNTLSTLAIAFMSGISGYLFYGIFDNSWYDFRMVLMFWIITALGMSAYNIMHSGNRMVTE